MQHKTKSRSMRSLSLPFYLWQNCYLSNFQSVIESRHFYETAESFLPPSLRLAETRYRNVPPVATSPTLKSRSLHLGASILISFHAIFLLLISIHEIRPCATAVAGAIGESEREKEKVVSFSLSSSLPRFFLVRCLRKVNNAFIFIASLQRGLINHGTSRFSPRDTRLYLMTL